MMTDGCCYRWISATFSPAGTHNSSCQSRSSALFALDTYVCVCVLSYDFKSSPIPKKEHFVHTSLTLPSFCSFFPFNYITNFHNNDKCKWQEAQS